MSGYDDLIPGPSPTRRSAYDDLLPGGAPAPAERPAEGAAAPSAGEAAVPGTDLQEIASAKSAETASKKLAAIRKKVRAIEWSRDMSPADKREAVKDHNAEMQDIASEQTALYRAAKKSYARPAMQETK